MTAATRSWMVFGALTLARAAFAQVPAAAPQLTALTRTSGAVVSAGDIIAFDFAITAGTDTVSWVAVWLQDAEGEERPATTLGSPLGGSVSLATAPDWRNGNYVVTKVMVATPTQGTSTYHRNGSVICSAPEVSGPTTHALMFSALDFTLSGGVTPSAAPTITAQPMSRSLSAGMRATFSIVASGLPPLSYQWTRDGAPVPGGTDASLSLNNVGPETAGIYRVTVANGAGSITSDPVFLRVAEAHATHVVLGPGYRAGGTVMVRNTLAYGAGKSHLVWQVLLPPGWSFSAGGGQRGDVGPAPGTTELLEWIWTTIPTSPFQFTYTLLVPPDTAGTQSLVALAILREDCAGVERVVQPSVLAVDVIGHHSADTDHDYRIGLVELTRLIALYNVRSGTIRTGAYAVEAGTEDGFAPAPTRPAGAVATLTRHHAADSDRDGRIGLLELTRVIELFNTYNGTTRTGAYRPQSGTEDGYAAGL